MLPWSVQRGRVTALLAVADLDAAGAQAQAGQRLGVHLGAAAGHARAVQLVHPAGAGLHGRAVLGRATGVQRGAVADLDLLDGTRVLGLEGDVGTGSGVGTQRGGAGQCDARAGAGT